MIVFLTGFMGSGKSRIARELAQKKGWKYIDTDKEIEKQVHMSVREIFSEKGEPYFRSLEEEIIKGIGKIKSDCVAALGGGALMSDRSLKFVLKTGLLIYIKSEAEAIYQRVRHTSKRPLLQENNNNLTKDKLLVKIKDLLEIREPGYAHAHLTIHRDNLEADDVADQIISFLEQQHYG